MRAPLRRSSSPRGERPAAAAAARASTPSGSTGSAVKTGSGATADGFFDGFVCFLGLASAGLSFFGLAIADQSL